MDETCVLPEGITAKVNETNHDLVTARRYEKICYSKKMSRQASTRVNVLCNRDELIDSMIRAELKKK